MGKLRVDDQCLAKLGVSVPHREESPGAKICRMLRDWLQPPADRNRGFSDQELLRQAHQEIIEAQNRFSLAHEPEMVDCAIYALKAAEIRYGYLIKRIKESRRT